MRVFPTMLLTLAALSPTGCASASPVANEQAACTIATAKVTAIRGVPTSHVALCDHASHDADSAGYYVMALRAYCHEELCGSTNMGWFAVRKTTGEVLEWDVGNWRVGPPLSKRS